MQGRVLGNRYRLLSQLGQGGMGSVWQAEQLNLPIKLAIKLIDPAQANSVEVRERFKREAHAAAKLRSMHIVHISDYGIDEDTPYLAMELLEGESLAARLQRKRTLGFEEALRILSQIAKALTFAHENGIVHRDLKPENVFIEGYVPQNDEQQAENELVKVLDFGVAKMLDTRSFGSELHTRTGVFLGTPFYMSPEQIRDSSAVDHRTDIWSFGVIAYECLTGQRPFKASNLADLQFAICRDPMILPSQVGSVPQGFDAWFEQVAARELAQRFPTIKAAMAALRAIQGAGSLRAGEVVSSLPPAQSASLPLIAESVSSRQVAPVAPEVSSAPPVAPNTVDPSSVTSSRLLSRNSRSRFVLTSALLVGAASLLGFWYARSTATLPVVSGSATVTAVPRVSSPEPSIGLGEAPRVLFVPTPASALASVVAPGLSEPPEVGRRKDRPLEPKSASTPLQRPPTAAVSRPRKNEPVGVSNPLAPANEPNKYGFE